MIADASAILAILFREDGHEELLRKLSTADDVAIAAPTVVETGIVLTARIGEDATTRLARFLQEARITIIPFAEMHWQKAVEAYARFGKGKHAAALNFGDCISYAVAAISRQPLLCVGRDFRRTDIELA